MLFPVIISAEIKEIDHFSELESVVDTLKTSDWLLFDIDYTLIEPAEPALQMSVIKQNKQRFRDELSTFSEFQKEIVPLLMVTHSPSRLTDPCVPSLIQKVKDKNIPLLGFTAIDTSSIPQCGSIPSWRVSELAKCGLSFHVPNSIFPNQSLHFTEFPPFRDAYPLYEKGILYCNVLPSKGDVLHSFLIKSSLKPSKIVLVDDTLENLKSVELKLADLGIPFLGIHYKIKVDAANLPNVSDDHWRAVWDQIHKRANSIDP